MAVGVSSPSFLEAEERRGLLSRHYLVLVAVALFLIPLGMGRLYNVYNLSLFFEIFAYGIILIGYDILAGYSGQISFGHALLFGLGGYTTGIMLKFQGWSLVEAMLASLAVSLVSGFIVGFLATRTRGIYFAFITLAFAQPLYDFTKTYYPVGGDDGLQDIPMPWVGVGPLRVVRIDDFVSTYYLALVLLIICFLVARRIVKSPFGKVLEAIRENEERAEFLGFNVKNCKWKAFIISSMFTGLGGALWVSGKTFISPDGAFHWSLSGQIVVMCLLGGKGTLVGPILGGAAYVFLDSRLSTFMPGSWQIVFGGIFIIFILFFPGGLYGLIRRLTRLIRRGTGGANASSL